ncbi:hypothetical protein [Natronosalvus halobius]|uniref:hypothetical protein n=1 Tax=Natronosalvus halobius TaxID=2953746 RepID=UPI00209DE0FB|nr:hypothetical protein [Natronosalvus halobius]USZ73760.1 hypothetical protein NGM15_18660 [Natronosalvus halobius]
MSNPGGMLLAVVAGFLVLSTLYAGINGISPSVAIDSWTPIIALGVLAIGVLGLVASRL